MIALCGALAGTEAGVVRYVLGLTLAIEVSPQITALWPYGSFHDVRWLLVYHRSWFSLVGAAALLIVGRGLFDTALTALAWPAQFPRPSLRRLTARNVGYAALLAVILSPWAALSVVVGDVSLGWFVFGSVVPVLSMAPFLQRGGMIPGWWRGLPPRGTVVLSILNFLTLTAGSGLVTFAPYTGAVPMATVLGGINGLLWNRAVRIAVADQTARWRRVPVTPVAIGLVIVLMFVVGIRTQLGVSHDRVKQSSVIGEMEATATSHPAIFLAGYNSHYDGQQNGATLPIKRFSYAGLEPDGRPKPYSPIATHQSIITSAQLLATQIDQIHGRTGRPVALIGESEGGLVARYYLLTRPHPAVDRLALLSPPVLGGHIYYPPRRAHAGWGIVTGWELRGMFAALSVTGQLPSSADEDFLRSYVDNAPLFRGKQMLCPIRGVQTIAFVPTLDGVAVPPGFTWDVPVVDVPGTHGVLVDQPAVRQRLLTFLNEGRAEPQRRWDYSALQWIGAAWQSPALKLQKNPVWDNVAGRSTRNYKANSCLFK